MAKEIERKFLLSAGIKKNVNIGDFKQIIQHYLMMGDVEVRVREVRDTHTDFFLTMKQGSGLAREEIETKIPWEVFSRLMEHTKASISKKRYKVERWEFDFFCSPFDELVIAEIELTHENEEITIPHWMASYVVREVTDDPQYKNVNLARLAESVNRLYE